MSWGTDNNDILKKNWKTVIKSLVKKIWTCLQRAQLFNSKFIIF